MCSYVYMCMWIILTNIWTSIKAHQGYEKYKFKPVPFVIFINLGNCGRLNFHNYAFIKIIALRGTDRWRLNRVIATFCEEANEEGSLLILECLSLKFRLSISVSLKSFVIT